MNYDRQGAQASRLFDRRILGRASRDSFLKLSPAPVARNPVMFVVEIGSVLTTLFFVRDLFAARARVAPLWFTAAVSLWLWFTVLFANFAEAVAEGRGKAQADSLRRMRTRDQRAPAPRTALAEVVSATALRDGRPRRRRGGRADPRRRRGDRGRRVRRRVGDHRRVGPRHPRERRRSLGGDRRDQGAFRSHRRAHHRRTRARRSSTA